MRKLLVIIVSVILSGLLVQGRHDDAPKPVNSEVPYKVYITLTFHSDYTSPLIDWTLTLYRYPEVAVHYTDGCGVNLMTWSVSDDTLNLRSLAVVGQIPRAYRDPKDTVCLWPHGEYPVSPYRSNIASKLLIRGDSLIEINRTKPSPYDMKLFPTWIVGVDNFEFGDVFVDANTYDPEKNRTDCEDDICDFEIPE